MGSDVVVSACRRLITAAAALALLATGAIPIVSATPAGAVTSDGCTIVTDGYRIDGTEGDDVICIVATGANRPRFVDAGGGDDIIRGSADREFIDGGDGDDIIDGAGNRDRIRGGAGVDRCMEAFRTECEHLVGADNTDTQTTALSTGADLSVTASGITVAAPAGAIDAGETLTITVGVAAPDTPAGWDATGPAIGLTTSQGQPNSPVFATIPYDVVADTAAGQLYHYSTEVGGWYPLPTAATTGGWVSTLTEFSPSRWLNQFRAVVARMSGDRYEGELTCVDPPTSWVTGVIMPSGANDPTLGCFTTGSDDSQAVIAIANNRGYPQVLRASHAFDYSFGVSTEVSAALLEIVAGIGTHLSENLVVLAPGQSARVTIDRASLPEAAVVQFTGGDPSFQMYSTMVYEILTTIAGWANIDLAPLVALGVADCFQGFGFPASVNDLPDLSKNIGDCVKAIPVNDAGFSAGVRDKIVLLQAAILVVESGTLLLDGLADAGYPGKIEFQSRDNNQDAAITVASVDLGDIPAGTTVTHQLTASGGTAPYTFSLGLTDQTTVPPAWITVSTSGLLSVSPPAGHGDASFKVYLRAEDANGIYGPFARDYATFTVVAADPSPHCAAGDERCALLAIHDAVLVGAASPGWGSDAHHCTWHGITCNDDGKVSRLLVDRMGEVAGTIPGELGILTSLEWLSARGTGITGLPDEIGALTELNSLIIEDTPLAQLPATIGQASELRFIEVSNGNLQAVPPSIGGLTKLRFLQLPSNRIDALPAEVGLLASLWELDLRHNDLTSLPDALGNLAALATLNLWNNELDSLPETFDGLTSLVSLNLSGNRLTALPATIPTLTTLQTLDLAFNEIAQLPAQLAELTGLQRLGLHSNRLTSLPETIGSLTALRRLDLSKNLLGAWPQQINTLTNLQELLLDATGIGVIPAEVGGLTSLTWLNVGRNGITELPPQIGNLTNLVYLDAWGNELTTLPVEVALLTSLQRLTLASNRFTGDISAWADPLAATAAVTELGLADGAGGNDCLTVVNEATRVWLDSVSPLWDECDAIV